MFTPILPAPTQHPSAQHQYQTRIRSNSAIKPSIRLRQSPDAPPPPRRVKPMPASKAKQVPLVPASEPSYLPFPPPHVVLHADDASSKVFLSIGRALMSVDNRAMTVKDLAELCMQYGLMCQNLSAAGQAITTFIRNHLQRCDLQQDQPLLLRHTMSGTISDDELVPALYSRVGGAHCTHAETETRLTNFRRGTMVWYLSKAAGAPCPFARAGIRLCDYNENGKVGMPINPGREKKRERDRLRKAAQTAGQKRKRLLRSCADKVSDTVSDSSDEEEQRPPKVKLTLRLKPSLASTPSMSASDLAATAFRAGGSQDPEPTDVDNDADSDESDSDSMSVDSDSDEYVGSSSASPPYAKHSTAIPACYPSVTNFPTSFSSSFPVRPEDRRRSPSVPFSGFSSSPPPDSEEEDEDFHITMTGARRLSVGRPRTPLDDEDSTWEDDFFGEFDADTETQWESPGPRSPSVQVEDEVKVKQEPTDVRGLLDAWEHQATDLKVIDVVAQAAAAERQAAQSTSDDFATWAWPGMEFSEELEHIKQEDMETDIFWSERDPTPPLESLSPVLPFDPCESPVEECPLRVYQSRPSYELQWRDVEILGPDSVKPRDLEDGAWHEYRAARAVSPEERIQSSSPEPSTTAATTTSPSPSPKLSRSALVCLNMQSTCTGREWNPQITSPSLLASLTSLSIQTPTPLVQSMSSLVPASKSQPVEGAPSQPRFEDESLVLHTTLPSSPAISATRFEDVPVYQVTLGASTILRRIDTDFVNVSPIAQHLKAACPSVPSAVVINTGSVPVRGTWAPLNVARETAKDELALSTFLSDDLCSLFPEAIQTLRSPDRSGCQFKSVSEARRRSMICHRLELPPREFEASWEDHLSTHPPFILATAAIDGHRPTAEEEPAVMETPLSPTEEEMFRVLCAAPEWESPSPIEQVEDTIDSTKVPCRQPIVTTDSTQERPLRRSKRVANAATTRSRTRSSRRGSRTSLS